MLIGKICPIILRTREDEIDILAFEHPLAGKQLVKGTIEAGETIQEAAARELLEESGVTVDAAWLPLGSSTSIAPDQRWTFLACYQDGLPERWTFHCRDDGGHDFRFFWHGLYAATDDHWHSAFVKAAGFVQDNLPLISA